MITSSIDREIGGRIKVFRLARRMSAAAVGAAVGLTYQQIQKYEYGTNRVSASMLIEIAEVLGVRASDLLSNNKGDDHDPRVIDIAARISTLPDHLSQPLIQLIECIVDQEAAASRG